MRQAGSITLFCVALLTAASAAGADVLVTTDGTIVETKGPWQQRGKMVVFTLENGQLSALRAADVDFEATERWRTELSQTAEPAPSEAAAAPKARLVLTDADVAHQRPLPEAAEAEPAAGQDEGETTGSELDPSTQSPVRVTAWDQDEPADGRGRRVFGTLRNDGNTFATDVSIEVTAYDNDGAIAGTVTTAPVLSSLRPGESTTFSVQFPEVYIVGAARIRVSSLDLELGSGEEAEGNEL